MKSILYSVCIGSLALALTAGGAQAATDKRTERAKPQQRSAKVQAARPANTGRTMAAHRNVSATQHRQLSNAKPRTSSAINRKPVAATRSSQRIGGGGAPPRQLQFANETSPGTKGCVSGTRKSFVRDVTLR